MHRIFPFLNKEGELKCLNVKNYAHAHQLIFEHIESFYNMLRIHSHCDYLSLNQYEISYE